MDGTGDANEVLGAQGQVTDHTYAGANGNLDPSVPPVSVPSGSQQPTGATGSNQGLAEYGAVRAPKISDQSQSVGINTARVISG